MLNFDNLDGFVINLTNKETCKEWFESCFTLEKDESYDDLSLQRIKRFYGRDMGKIRYFL